MWSQKCFVAGRGNRVHEGFQIGIIFLWFVVASPKIPLYSSCKQLFDANLRLQGLIGFKREILASGCHN